VTSPGDGAKSSPYLLDRARRAGHKELIVVEGLFDVALLQARGETRAVASVAAQFSGEQLKTLVRCGIEKVYVVGDPDGGGDRGTLANVEALLNLGITPYVPPRLPDGMDPDEFILERGMKAWNANIKQSVHGLRHKARLILTEYGEREPGDDQWSDDVVRKAREYAARFGAEQRDALRRYFWPEIAAATGSRVDDLCQTEEATRLVSQDSQDSLGSFDSLELGQAWPEPPEKAAYYGLAGEIVDAIDPHTEASREALLIQFLVAFGNLIGRKPYRVIGGSRHHCNLFAILVGKTGKGRKGTSWAWIERFIEATGVDPEWLKDRVQPGLSSGEGVIYAIRDPLRVKEPVKNKKSGLVLTYQDTIRDHGVEDKRLLILEEEFASALRVAARDGNTLSPLLRQLWDGKRLGNLTKNSPYKATDPHGSILGHITRSDLLENLKSNEKANGYANRFLWVCTRRSKVLPDGGGIPQWGGIIADFKTVVDHARGSRPWIYPCPRPYPVHGTGTHFDKPFLCMPV
jgi:hypothetical protein